MKHTGFLIALCTAAAFCMSCLTGCGGERQDGGFEIVTTVYAAYDLAKQLTADFDTPCEIRLLLTPGGESHSYEPSPSDAAAVQRCDLFVYIGGESEQWAEQMIASGRADKPSLRLFDSVTPLTELHEGADGAPEEESDEEPEYDEHIWTSPLNADAMLSALHDTLNTMLPDETAHCDAARDAMHADFLELDAYAQDIRDNARTNLLVFADRFPFRYLTDAYGWDHLAAFSGCSSDTDASAATLSMLITRVREEQIGTVFYLENSSQKISDAVCRATGARAVMMQSGNNVSAEDFRAEKHLQEIMRENLDAVKEALS